MRLVLLLLASIACLPMTTEAQTAGAATGARPGAADPITYTLRFPDAPRHYVDVEASFPAAGQKRIELMMAVWTPGSYLVREYARHVEGLEVVQPSGAAAPIKTRKNRWAIDTGGAARVVVRYRVYGREMTVRTNWIESRFALLQGPATYLTLVGGLHRPHQVTLDMPAGWTRAMSGLPEMSGRPHTFEAADYDTLVDGPIVAGDLKVYEFTRSGKPHYLVNVNEGGSWDGARAIGDVERIVAEHEKLWGSLPYDKYVFVNMITEASGGLEHRNSSVLMTSRWAMGTRQAYVGWLNLVSHEFFHVWNVKRLRPAALGPFDYENENYTPSLWVSEGSLRTTATCSCGAQASRATRSSSGRCRPTSEAWRRRRAPGAAGHAVVLRRLDQAVPSRRELRQYVDQLLREGSGDRAAARRAHPPGHQRPAVPRRRDAHWPSHGTGARRASPKPSSAA